MVQMGDPGAMERAKANLTGSYFFDGKLQSGYVGCSAFQIRFNEYRNRVYGFSCHCRYSKQLFLQDVPNPVQLPDGSLSFMDFMGSRLNRYQNPDAASKNRVHPPSKTLYYWNAPVDWTEDEIKAVNTAEL